jgi:hypothetical protein
MTLRLLLSLPYLTERILARLAATKNLEVLIDSGAYTAWRAGQVLSLPDYVHRIRGLPSTSWRYFSLDVVGDAEATVRNHLRLREQGLLPIPVFQRGGDVELLARTGDDLAGIGGLVGQSGTGGYLKRLSRSFPAARQHWLGFAATAFIAALRPASVDSSVLYDGVRFGRIAYYEGQGRFQDWRRRHFATAPPTAAIRDRLASWGLDYRRLQRADEWRHLATRNTMLIQVPLAGYFVYAHELRQQTGTDYYISGITTDYKLEQVLFERDRLCQSCAFL